MYPTTLLSPPNQTAFTPYRYMGARTTFTPYQGTLAIRSCRNTNIAIASIQQSANVLNISMHSARRIFYSSAPFHVLSQSYRLQLPTV